MIEFVEIKKYGKLYIDRILFESYFPIIFTCKNDDGKIFICVCCRNNEKGCKWLIGKTNGRSIIRMLKDEITIRELLVKFSSGNISVDHINGEYIVEYNNSDWNEDSIYLPKNDSYMFAEEGEFDDDIAYFLSVDHVCYDTEYYKSILDVLGKVSKDVEPMTETLNIDTPILGNITISSEVLNVLEVFGKVCINLSFNAEKYTDQKKYKLAFDSSFKASTNDLCLNIGTDNNLTDAA